MKKGEHNLTYLIGAGAELEFGLLSGANYTHETMLTRKDKLYEALEKKYDNNIYMKEFHLRKNSIIYVQTICNAIHKCYSNESEEHHCCGNNSDKCRIISEIVSDSEFDFGNITNSINNIFKKFCGENERESKKLELDKYMESLFKFLVEGKRKENGISPLCSVANHLEYYGIMESYFYSILKPEKYNRNFSKLINYFWSAYFSILIPLYMNLTRDTVEDNSEKENKILKSMTGTIDYGLLLENLSFILTTVDKRINEYTDSSKNEELCTKYELIYQFNIEKNLNTHFITTNYTNLVSIAAGKEHKDNIAFIAGKLTTFENASTTKVWEYNTSKEITNSDEIFSKDDIVFPFMLTQAPIKPIVSAYEIREYSKAIQFLDASNHLIVLGYGMCEEDKHVLAIVSDYLENKENMMHYIYFIGDDTSDKLEQNKTRQLEILLGVSDRIKVYLLTNTTDSLKNTLDCIYSTINKQ